MIVDSSALVAIVRNDSQACQCLDRVFETQDRRISAANLLETSKVIVGAKVPEECAALDATIRDLQLVIDPVERAHVDVAREAFRQYGKGSGHGARLNVGECFAYVPAKSRGEPLLYIGDDFSRTDTTSAL